MARKGIKQNKYTQEFIETVIKEHLVEGKSVNYLAKQYQIPKGTIATWAHKYRERGSVIRQKRGRPVHDENADYKEKYDILKKYLEFLEEVERGKK